MIDAYTIRRQHLASMIEDARHSVRFAIETCERLDAHLNLPEPEPDYEALGYPETGFVHGDPDSVFINWQYTEYE